MRPVKRAGTKNNGRMKIMDTEKKYTEENKAYRDRQSENGVAKNDRWMCQK
jgi:hypothetical protein